MADIIVNVFGLPMLAVDEGDNTYSLRVATVSGAGGIEAGDKVVEVFGVPILAKIQADGTYALVVAT